MKYVDLVANDWGKGSSKKHRSISDQDEDATKIKVILSNKDDSVDIEKAIGVSAPLKTLFSDYADECGESLRSFRFSFNGRLLFLSAVGNKTAKDLGIEDGGVIQVNSTALKENEPPEPEASPAKVKKGRKRKEKKRPSVLKATQMKKGRQSSVIFNPETDRQRHSVTLTKVLDEMELRQLKRIRQHINKSMLLCQTPKTRSPSSCKSLNALVSSAEFNPSMTGLGGKAGRTQFSVNVGRVENLYKSSKKNRLNHASSSRASHIAKIDLHGCTKEEAMERLNEWEGNTMDTAMKGEYPFVVPAVIVCGGGTQILSELVENWIKEKKNVANSFA